MLFKNSVLTSKRTPNFTITSINFLTLFKEIITVYSENHAKPINTKYSITDCQSRWFIYLPLGLKGLIHNLGRKNLKGRDCLLDRGVDRGVISKLILGK
jgi:hypothetical protein